jgi:hypothetical protein
MRHMKSALLAAIFGLAAGAVQATEISFPVHVQKVEVKGDLRLRQDTIHDKENASPDRSRQRYRLRVGVDADLGSGFKVKTRFATGSNDQVSSNQTMENMSNQRSFSIDQVFLEYKPMESMVFRGGRMANPLWTVYSSDLIWDGDFNPEGLAESFKFSLFGSGRFFINMMQGVADEDNSAANQRDQYYLSNQIGLIMPLFSASRVTVGAALHQWINEGVTDNLPAASRPLDAAKHFDGTDGNRQVTAGNLVNQFNVAELTAEYATEIFVPVSFQGTYIKNQAHLSGDQLVALGVAAASARQKSDVGYQFGLIVKPGKFEVGLFRKVLKKDATVADVADSDFGDGGTNREGNIGWVGYKINDFLSSSVKIFTTARNNLVIDAKDDKNRVQVDLVAKF